MRWMGRMVGLCEERGLGMLKKLHTSEFNAVCKEYGAGEPVGGCGQSEPDLGQCRPQRHLVGAEHGDSVAASSAGLKPLG